jgi:hypothetical protein
VVVHNGLLAGTERAGMAAITHRAGGHLKLSVMYGAFGRDFVVFSNARGV